MIVGGTNSSPMSRAYAASMAATRARGVLPHPVDDRVVAPLDPLPALVAVHREVAAADRSRCGHPGGRRPARPRARARTRAPSAGACRGRRAARGGGTPATPSRRPARPARRCADRGHGRRPGPTSPTTFRRPRVSRARRHASRSAGRAKNEPSAIAASIRGRSWSTGRPAPMLRCPTSELPIWPGRQARPPPPRPPAARAATVRAVRAKRASAPRRWHPPAGSDPIPNPSMTTSTIGRGRPCVAIPGRVRRSPRPRAPGR